MKYIHISIYLLHDWKVSPKTQGILSEVPGIPVAVLGNKVTLLPEWEPGAIHSVFIVVFVVFVAKKTGVTILASLDDFAPQINQIKQIQVDRKEALGKTELLAALALTESPMVRKLINCSWVQDISQKIDFS